MTEREFAARATRDAVAGQLPGVRPWWEQVPSVNDLKFVETKWIVPGLLPESALILLAARPGSFKSMFSLALAGAVAKGDSFALMPSTGAREVMYLDCENSPGLIAQRREFLRIGHAPQLRYWTRGSALSFPEIDSEELLSYAREMRPLLVFDTLTRLHRADENSNTEMAAVMGGFIELARAGACCLVLHHATKTPTQNFRGASEIEAAPDVAYRLDRDSDGDGRSVTLSQFKNRFGGENSFQFRLTDDNGFERWGDQAAPEFGVIDGGRQ